MSLNRSNSRVGRHSTTHSFNLCSGMGYSFISENATIGKAFV